jgi:hypothetical protein
MRLEEFIFRTSVLCSCSLVAKICTGYQSVLSTCALSELPAENPLLAYRNGRRQLVGIPASIQGRLVFTVGAPPLLLSTLPQP